MSTDDIESRLKLHAVSPAAANEDEPDANEEEIQRKIARRMAEEAVEELNELSTMVSRAWDTKERTLQRSLVLGLVERASGLAFVFERWSDDEAFLRYARLVAREHDAFEDFELDEIVWALGRRRAACVPELGLLILECARARRQPLEDLIYRSDFFPDAREVARVAPECGARLAEMVRLGDDDEQLSALEWLRCGVWPEVAPALRTKLSSRLLPHRTLALRRMFEIGALEPDDVVPTLEDLFNHTPPDPDPEQTNFVGMLEDALETAIMAVRPATAAKTLTAMSRNEGACAHLSYFDSEWAMRLLVHVDPDGALEGMERRMSMDVAWMRESQVENARGLPDRLAGPVLARLLDDPSPAVGAMARGAWQARYPYEPVPERGAGPAQALLPEAEASSWFRAQLARAETEPEERQQLFRELWAAPPSTEVLVLLVRLASDEALIDRPQRRDLDTPPARLAVLERLVERFGNTALDAAALAATQVPNGDDGWLSSLIARHKRQPLPEAVRHMLGDTLVRLLKTADRPSSRWAVAGLDALGESARVWRPLLELADAEGHISWSAASSLEKLPPHAEYDQWLEREAKRALQGKAHERAQQLVSRAVTRMPEFVASLVLERLPKSEPPKEGWFRYACVGLVRTGHLPLEPFLQALQTPESWLFDTAIRVFNARRDVEPPVEECLRALLESDARRGAAAAQAAAVLVQADRLPADDPQVFEIAARAPANDAAWLLLAATTREDEPGVFAFAVARTLLAATDEDRVAHSLAGLLSLREGWSAFFRGLEPRLPEGKVRVRVREGLDTLDGKYEEVDTFWLGLGNVRGQ